MDKKDHDNKMRYHAALHGVQSAVAYEIEMHLTAAAVTPKHLRVGINAAMVDSAAIAGLLIAKGIITESEYYEALANAAEQELARYHARYPRMTFA